MKLSAIILSVSLFFLFSCGNSKQAECANENPCEHEHCEEHDHCHGDKPCSSAQESFTVGDSIAAPAPTHECEHEHEGCDPDHNHE